MDSDDKYPNQFVLEHLYEAAEKNEVNIAGGEFSSFYSNGKFVPTTDYDNNLLSGYLFNQSGIIEYMDYQFDYGYHRFIYNRDFLIYNNINFPNLIRYQDPPFMVKAFTLAEKFYALDEITYCYRISHKTMDWTEKKVYDLLCGIRMNMEWADSYGFDELYDLSVRRMVYEYRYCIAKNINGIACNKVENCFREIINNVKGEDNIRLLMQMIIDKYKDNSDRIENSISYRLGMTLTYPLRKIRKGYNQLR
jgi:hypothetical protein